MIKITAETTLLEMMLLRARLGVQRVNIDYDYVGRFKHVRVVLFGQYYDEIGSEVQAIGQGETEIQALDDAFNRLWHREVRRIMDMPVAPE